MMLVMFFVWRGELLGFVTLEPALPPGFVLTAINQTAPMGQCINATAVVACPLTC